MLVEICSMTSLNVGRNVYEVLKDDDKVQFDLDEDFDEEDSP